MKPPRILGFILSLAFALVLTVASLMARPAAAYAVDAATDAPQLIASSLKVSRKEAKAGNKVTFSVTIKGSLKRAPELWIIPKSKLRRQWKEQRVKLARVGTSTTFRGSFTVRENTLPGTWQVSNVNMWYWHVNPETGTRESAAIGFYNTQNVRGTWDADEKGSFANADFKVVGTTADTASPELVGTSLDKKTVPVRKPWPKLQVTFKDASRIEFATLYFVVGGKTYSGGLDRVKGKTFVIPQNGGSGDEEDFEGAFMKGKHKIKAIMVEDVHRNRTLYVDKRFKSKVRALRLKAPTFNESDLYKSCYRYVLEGQPMESNFCIVSKKSEIKYADLSGLDFTVV